MKSLKQFLITLLINLSILFVIFPKIVFATNIEVTASTGGNHFPVIFITAMIISVILAFVAYVAGEIVNRK